MKDLKHLERLQKKKKVVKSDKIRAVTYTRISSNGQSNFSIELQEETITEYCLKYDIEVVGQFGGKAESAKTDNRKEFNKLLDFIRQKSKTKSPINALIVSQLDRFSRSDDNIYLYNKVKKMGVKIYKAINGQPPCDIEDDLGDKIELLLANQDNQKRRKNCIGGMIKKLQKGELIGKPPMGYDYYGPLVRDKNFYSHEQKVLINEDGKKLRKAWQWKLQGHNDTVIMNRLKSMGVKMYKQKLSKMWRNTFYCGVRFSSLLEEPVVGLWEPMVSIKEFAKVNGFLKTDRSHYESTIMEDYRPLQGFIYCPECGRKFTGYRSTKTGTHYYKCSLRGCSGGNINAERTQNSTQEGMHDLFRSLLESYSLNIELKPIFKDLLEKTFKELDKETTEQRKWLKTQKTVLENDIEGVTTQFFRGKIKESIYDKMISKMETDMEEIDSKLEKLNFKSSNLLKKIDTCVEITSNLPRIWDLANYEDKQIIQKTCFYNEIKYFKKNRQLRTSKVNTVLSEIRRLKEVKQGKNEKDSSENSDESLLVESAGLEPASKKGIKVLSTCLVHD